MNRTGSGGGFHSRKDESRGSTEEVQRRVEGAGDPDGAGCPPGPGDGTGAIKRVADQLGIHPEALRTWVRQAEIDGGLRPGTTSDDSSRIVELEREVRELRRANEILRTSAAFFAAAELDRKIK